MVIQENVNPGAETRQLSKIPFEYRKNIISVQLTFEQIQLDMAASNLVFVGSRHEGL